MFRLPQTKFTSGSAFNSLHHPKVEFKLLCQQLVGSKKRQQRRMRGGKGGDEEEGRRADRSVLGAPRLCSACTHWLSIAFQGLMPSTAEMNMIIWMWQQMLCSRKCLKRVTQLQKRKEKKDTPKVLSSVLSSQMQVSFSLGCQNQILSFSSLQCQVKRKCWFVKVSWPCSPLLKKKKKKKPNTRHAKQDSLKKIRTNFNTR